MLSSTSPRETLFACLPVLLRICLPSPWSPPFPLHAPALILLSLVQLDSLPPHDLVLWTDGSVPFPFGKSGSGVLANCSLYGIEATLSFSAGPVCFFAEACAIPHALCCLRNTNKSAIFLLFSYYLTLVLSSPLSFLLSQTLWQIWHELSSLSSCSIRLQWSPDTRFYRGTTRLMSWPDRERYLRPPQSLVVSLLLSLVSSLLFSRTGGVLSHLNSWTHWFLQFPPRNLCSLAVLAVFSLVYAATNTAYF